MVKKKFFSYIIVRCPILYLRFIYEFRCIGKCFIYELKNCRKLCLDPIVRPTPNNCLVYSFGIGYDFSFDAAMGKYGCQVFSFDDDSAHELLDRNPYPR